MNHLSEKQLILFHYGEVGQGEPLAAHLERCSLCRSQYQALQNTLGSLDMAPIPERSEEYGQAVWQQLRSHLPTQTSPSGFGQLWARMKAGGLVVRWPRWSTAAGMALLIGAAFLAGRFWPQAPNRAERKVPPLELAQPTMPQPWSFLEEIGDHLERSQLALIELVNSRTNGAVDISGEQVLARELVDVNRLYCQTASRLGDSSMMSTLEDLERALVEISNSPSTLSSAQFAEFRRRLHTDDILFKVRVVSSLVRAREKELGRNMVGNRS